MPLIAITREMGSCGTEIAAQVASALGIPVVHREIADLVTNRWGTPREMILDPRVARSGRFKRLRSLATPTVSYVSLEVFSAAASGSAVFRGWGAAQLFRKVPHAIGVRVCAPFKVRLKRMCERTRLEKSRVERLVRENDEIRAQLVREYFGCDWRDPTGYDLVINTGRSSVNDAVDQILSLADQSSFQETPRTRQRLENLRLEALARATLYGNSATRDLRIHIKASGDELVLGGVVDDGAQREQVIRLLSNLPGKPSITSRLRAPTDYYTRTSSI